METRAPAPALSTYGKIHWPGYEHALVHNPEETLDPLPGLGTRFRLVLIDRGSGILACDGGRTVFSAPALFCFNEAEETALIRPKDLHAQSLYFHPSLIHYQLDFVNVRSREAQFNWNDQLWLRPFVARKEGWSVYTRLGPAAFVRVSGLLEALARELKDQRDDFWPCRSRSFLLEILFLLERVSTIPGEALQGFRSDDPSLSDIEPVLLYLQNHFGEKMTLDRLAREFHTNRTTLTRRFHDKTGMPVMAYLGRLRIDLAALMLRDTSIPVGEIVARTGFASLTHFSRTFRKSTGFTPSKYRRKYCWVM